MLLCFQRDRRWVWADVHTSLFFASLRSSVSIWLVDFRFNLRLVHFPRSASGDLTFGLLGSEVLLRQYSLPGIHVCNLKSSGALLLPLFHRGASVYKGTTSMRSTILSLRISDLIFLRSFTSSLNSFACSRNSSSSMRFLSFMSEAPMARFMHSAIMMLRPCTFSIVHESFCIFFHPVFLLEYRYTNATFCPISDCIFLAIITTGLRVRLLIQNSQLDTGTLGRVTPYTEPCEDQEPLPLSWTRYV